MITNPNVLVRNLFENIREEQHSASLSTRLLSVDVSGYSYLLIHIDITERNSTSYLRVQNVAADTYYPIYDVYTKCRFPLYQSYNGVAFARTGEYFMYVDVSELSSVVVRFNSSPAVTAKDYIIGVSNVLPSYDKDVIYTILDSEPLASDLGYVFYPNKKYVEIGVNLLSDATCLSKIRVTNLDSSNGEVPKLVRVRHINSNASLTTEAYITFPGWNYYYVDASNIKNLRLQVLRNSYNPTLLVKIKMTDVLDAEYRDENPIIDVPNSPIYLEYIGETTACWNNHRVHISDDGHSISYINTNNGLMKRIADISSILGEGIYIAMNNYAYREIKVIPYPYSNTPGTNTNNNNAKVNLVCKGTDGNYYYCDITDAGIDDAAKWGTCKFWEKKNTKRKIPTKDASIAANDTTHFRYDTTLPDNMYLHTDIHANGFIEYQDNVCLRTLGPMAISKKFAVLGQYDIDGYRVNLWGTSDGGKNFVSLYDFSPREWSHINHNLLPINTSQFGAYSNDLNMFKVTRNVPTNEVKEPEHPYTLSEITVTNITSADECVVTAPSHGLNSGDVVAFTSNTNTDWKQLSSTGVSQNFLGDNVYFIVKIDDNSFSLKYFRGSYDTNLTCRHIHSVNATNYGFLICTGEQYPDGWELYLEHNVRDGYVDVMVDRFLIYRLNSGEHSVQRCCGALLSAEKEPMLTVFEDHTAVFYEDDRRLNIDGRTGAMPLQSSFGIWRGKLSKIDSFYENFERIAASPEPSIWMYQTGDLIVNYMQQNGLMVSIDGGNTFTYIPNVGNGLVSDVVWVKGIIDNCICCGKGYLIKRKSK